MSEIYKALLAARKAISDIGRDGQNSFHKYKYASAEATFSKTRKALHDHGLMFFPSPVEPRPAGSIKEKTKNGEVERPLFWFTYTLAHESGDSLDTGILFAVAPENGRPADKACAATSTAAMSYALRRLLQLEVVDKSEELNYDGRDKPADQSKVVPQEADISEAVKKVESQTTAAGLLKVFQEESANMGGKDVDRLRAACAARKKELSK